MNRKKACLTATSAFSILALAACGGTQTTKPQLTSDGASATTRGPVTSQPPPPSAGKIGVAYTVGAVTLTVNSVSTPDTVPLMTNSYKAGSGYDRYSDTPPEEGGRFVRLETTIMNSGKSSSFDVLCSLPVRMVVLDSEAREFKSMGSMFKIKGNGDCRDIQPGFKANVTWIFTVPKDSRVKFAAFSDPASYSTLEMVDISNQAN